MRQVARLQADRRERQPQEEREARRVPELERPARSQATRLQADHPAWRAQEEQRAQGKQVRVRKGTRVLEVRQATQLQVDHPERRALEERQPPKVLPLREVQKPVRPGKHVTRSPNPSDVA